MNTEFRDDKGNVCTVAYFGSEKAAQKALASLKGCRDCRNCSHCSGCSRCWGCSDCSDCSRCSGCSGCSDCSRCSDCSHCSDCWGCSGCSGCSDCSDCWGCSRCSDCSHRSGCWGCSDKHEDSARTIPAVPVVENLHARIYAAVTQPKALDMSAWHTCETTHCRAGWVVTLAGDQGRALEKFFNSGLAAMMIYDASCPEYKINPSRFYDSNKDALEDMRKLAEVPA